MGGWELGSCPLVGELGVVQFTNLCFGWWPVCFEFVGCVQLAMFMVFSKLIINALDDRGQGMPTTGSLVACGLPQGIVCGGK